MKLVPAKTIQKVLLKSAAPEIELLKEDDNTLPAPTPCNIEFDKSTVSAFLEGWNTANTRFTPESSISPILIATKPFAPNYHPPPPKTLTTVTVPAFLK